MKFFDFWYKVQFNLYMSFTSKVPDLGEVSCTTGCRSADFSFTTFGCATDRWVAVRYMYVTQTLAFISITQKAKTLQHIIGIKHDMSSWKWLYLYSLCKGGGTQSAVCAETLPYIAKVYFYILCCVAVTSIASVTHSKS
jgi:hypothetical protein